MSNSFESAIAVKPAQRPLAPFYLRILALLLWLIGLAPAAFIAVQLIADPPVAIRTPADWLGVLVLLSFWCLIPIVGFGLFGLGAWRQSWPLAAVGAVVAFGYVFLNCAFMISLAPMG